MPYNFVADSFLIKKLSGRLSSSEVRFYAVKRAFCVFNFHWGIEKRVVDFLLVLIELFSLGVTDEALRANIG